MSNLTDRLKAVSLAAIQPSAREAPKGNYIPTLIIGLGGTGIRTLRFLKSLLQGNPNHQIRLLGIDCDAAEADKYPELPPLTLREELVLLDATVADGTIVGAERRGDPYVLGYLPDIHERRNSIHTEVRNTMRRQRGAGQRRRVGRVLFEANAEGGVGLLQILQRKHDALRGLEARAELIQAGYNFLPHASVYVVSSLAGGTGAGSLMSALAMIRHIFSQPGDTITVIGTLPGRKLDEKLTDPYIERPATRANAIALLRELQAARTTSFPDYAFEFGTLAKQDASGISLADSVYLLDHELHDSTPVPSYEDICRAAGSFLYAFVGTGVGAADAAGEVNLVAAAGAGQDNVVRCFDCIGLSVLAYPIEGLLEYCGRDAVDRWGKRWIAEVADAGEARHAADALGGALSMQNSTAFRERLKALAKVAAPAFLADESERDAVVRGSSDDQLKGAAAAAIQSLADSLPTRLANLERDTEESVGLLLSGLRSGIFQAVGQSSSFAASILDQLLQTAQRCRSELLAEAASNEERLAELESKVVPKKEMWMDWLPGNVFGNRNDYIEAINEQMECLFNRGGAPIYLKAIGKIVSALEGLINDFDTALVAIQATLSENRKAISAIDRDQTGVDGLTIYAMRPCDFKPFVSDLPSAEIRDLGLERISAEEILAAVVRLSAPAYEAKLSSLDLAAEIKRRVGAGGGNQDFLLNALTAADAASQPRLRFRDNLPPLTELGPRKYLVGAGVDPEIAGRLTPRNAHANVTPVPQFSDPFRLLIVETFHNFGAAHWQGYEEARRSYDIDPWWRHILPEDKMAELPDFHG